MSRQGTPAKSPRKERIPSSLQIQMHENSPLVPRGPDPSANRPEEGIKMHRNELRCVKPQEHTRAA
eukprot:3473921-Pyramimonas_sp.AAC.1